MSKYRIRAEKIKSRHRIGDERGLFYTVEKKQFLFFWSHVSREHNLFTVFQTLEEAQAFIKSYLKYDEDIEYVYTL